MRSLVVVLPLLLMACQEYTISNQEKPPEEPLDTGVDPVPDIEVSPSALDFGYQPPLCATESEQFTITNMGDADLELLDIDYAGNVGAFSFGQTPVLLAPGDSVNVLVDFIAPSQGDFSDGLVITSNDPDEAVTTVSLHGVGAESGTVVDVFEQTIPGAVDVVFVVDNSGSMGDQLDSLNRNFGTFINNFVRLGLDYQLGVITTDMTDPAQTGRLQGPIVTPATPDPVAQFQANVNLGSSGSGSEQGFDAAYTALDPSQGLINSTNLDLVRAGSTLSVIVVTDEDDDSDNLNGAQFGQWLNNYQGGNPALTSFSAVAGPKSGLFPCGMFNGESATPAPRYYTAVQATGGIHVNICQNDWSSIVQQLSVVAAGVQTAFDLTWPPQGNLTVTVEGQQIPMDDTNGWSYDPATNTVYLHGNAVPEPGETVEVTYPAELECNP